MAKAINVVIDQEYQSDKDDDELKSTWMLRSLSGLEFLECTSRGYVDHDMILQKGLTGWKDFMDGEGNQIVFTRSHIGRIPPIILQDISFEIQKISTLTENERKNS